MPIYHIRIQGHVSAQYGAWFEPLVITREASGETLLAGKVLDQGELFGILLKIRDLGMTLLSVSSATQAGTLNRASRGPEAQRGARSSSKQAKGDSMANTQVTVTGFMMIQPGTEAQLLQHVATQIAATRREPGCLNYDFHRGIDDPTRFMFYENFADQAAFEAHLSAAHTREWVQVAEAAGARFDVQRWTMLSGSDHEQHRGER